VDSGSIPCVDVRDRITVEAIQQQQRMVGVQTSVGVIRAEHYVLAAGAWMNELLPLPVRPGQMLSVECLRATMGYCR